MFRFIVALMLLAFIACNENPVEEPSPVTQQGSVITARDIPADTASAGRFTFFRLSDSSIVASTDSNSTKWDLAFKGTTIITNSGVSGPGQGGAVVLKSTDFDTLSGAPASGFATDTSSTKLAIPTGSGKGWYNYTGSTGTPPNSILPIPGIVLVIRTADGKYAKVQIISYYKGAPSVPASGDKARLYTFKYYYQSDGSRKLK